MDPYLYWILTAIALVVVELLTGTFYLLVLAIAASAGAALAYINVSFPLQAVAATVIAVLGVVIVNRYRAGAARSATPANAIDVGQRVTIDTWIDEAAGLARVAYRGTIWDAKVIGRRGTHSVYYIRAVDGNTLHIAAE